MSISWNFNNKLRRFWLWQMISSDGHSYSIQILQQQFCKVDRKVISKQEYSFSLYLFIVSQILNLLTSNNAGMKYITKRIWVQYIAIPLRCHTYTRWLMLINDSSFKYSRTIGTLSGLNINTKKTKIICIDEKLLLRRRKV